MSHRSGFDTGLDPGGESDRGHLCQHWNPVLECFVSADQAALVSVVDLLTRLSPPNARLAESIIRCILAEQLSK